MGSPLSRIKDRLGGNERRALTEDDIPELHNSLMKYYECWIPLEEFRHLPLPTLWIMLKVIEKDIERQKKEMDKSNKRGRR